MRWDRVFIQYSATDQLAVLQGVREGGDALRNTLSESLASRIGPFIDRLRTTSAALAAVNVTQAAIMLVLMMTGLLLLAAILLKKPWKNSHTEKRAPAQQLFAVRIYGQMTDCLTARSIRKSAHETPAEFVRHVEREWAAGSSCVRKLTDLYCRVRFGQHPLTSEDVSVAQQLLCQLQDLG